MTDKKDYAQVNGGIVQQGSEPIGLSFTKRESGAWKIYDVAVDNVSTLDSYRTEVPADHRRGGLRRADDTDSAPRPRAGIDVG